MIVSIVSAQVLDSHLYGAETPPDGESGGDGVMVGAQAGDEGLQRRLAAGGGGGHPLLEVAAAGFRP